MDENQNTSLFGLNIDQTSKAYLAETARWARFLAITGFICLGLMIIYGILIAFMMTNMSNNSEMFGGPYGSGGFGSASGTFIIVLYLFIAVIAFFPLLFLLRFSNKMKYALDSNEQEVLNESFRYLKIYYQYVGILTIIALVLMVLGVLSMIMAGSMMSG